MGGNQVCPVFVFLCMYRTGGGRNQLGGVPHYGILDNYVVIFTPKHLRYFVHAIQMSDSGEFEHDRGDIWRVRVTAVEGKTGEYES